jgi:hypothetical protein
MKLILGNIMLWQEADMRWAGANINDLNCSQTKANNNINGSHILNFENLWSRSAQNMCEKDKDKLEVSNIDFLIFCSTINQIYYL